MSRLGGNNEAYTLKWLDLLALLHLEYPELSGTFSETTFLRAAVWTISIGTCAIAGLLTPLGLDGASHHAHNQATDCQCLCRPLRPLW